MHACTTYRTHLCLLHIQLIGAVTWELMVYKFNGKGVKYSKKTCHVYDQCFVIGTLIFLCNDDSFFRTVQSPWSMEDSSLAIWLLYTFNRASFAITRTRSKAHTYRRKKLLIKASSINHQPSFLSLTQKTQKLAFNFSLLETDDRNLRRTAPPLNMLLMQ